ncbi:uncharacterized protein BDZ99DRAFT_251281 [Mytilinidion resinicola]|uniref:Uncharacterized protein n=1 Tax=Mytilinidion resinicola TaxID=574789 RepID=A0A6A6YW60_9PEZI|nr:uncharacterized protein BDZ99DRAFT_251281 [Mytilinidion resinicola]KAF2813196.1 hypothetical protein BDZ99DRAFT_251281 [Mytilinidion resinicola]
MPSVGPPYVGTYIPSTLFRNGSFCFRSELRRGTNRAGTAVSSFGDAEERSAVGSLTACREVNRETVGSAHPEWRAPSPSESSNIGCGGCQSPKGMLQDMDEACGVASASPGDRLGAASNNAHCIGCPVVIAICSSHTFRWLGREDREGRRRADRGGRTPSVALQTNPRVVTPIPSTCL